MADSTVDLAADNLQMSVKKADLIGFAARIQADDGVANITWATTVDYGDGETYNSADDTKMDQGPIWYYYIHVARHRLYGADGRDYCGDGFRRGNARVPTGLAHRSRGQGSRELFSGR